MKMATGALLLISIAILAGSSEVKKPETQREVIETRVDYWRAHAYVNLSLMQYQVNQILKTDTLKLIK